MSAAAEDFYTPVADVDASRVLSNWAWFLHRPYELLGLSAFGDLFLKDTDGSIKMLDLVACELKDIGTCIEEFDWGLGDAAHQEDWLMAGLCRRVTESGMRRAVDECLAFRKPPILGGALEPENIVAWDRWAYYEGLAKLLPQVLDLPLGTEVVIKPSGTGG